MSRIVHLVRRFAGSLRTSAPLVADEVWAESFLLDGEIALWRRLGNVDRRHSLAVARRFAALGSWTRDQMAAALLHDVGKSASGLSTLERVGATIFGGRSSRWREYLDHERIGLESCRSAGSSDGTLAVLEGRDSDALRMLRRADDI